MEDTTQMDVTDNADVLSRIESALYPEDTAQPEEAAAEQEEAQIEDGTEPEAEEVEGEEVQEAQAEDDGEEITLDHEQLASLLGLQPDDVLIDEDGGLSLRTKIDGQLGKASLQEMVKNHQIEGHLTKKSQELAELRREFEATKADGMQRVNQSLNEAGALLQMLEGQLAAEYQAINWDQLRQDDPAEWSAKQQEMQLRLNQINQAKAQAGQQAQAITKEQQQRQDAELQALLVKESEMLVEKVPEWSDPAVAEREHVEIGKMLLGDYGFTSDEIENVRDHRLMVAMRDLQKLKAGNVAANAAASKIKKLPKLIKPGTPQKAGNAKQEQDKRLSVKLKKTGDVKDAAALLLSRMG